MKKDKRSNKILCGVIIICSCVVIVGLATIGIPLLINWLFTMPARRTLFAVDWDAKDALAYYGSALGFIGTVIFSGLALWQNHVIQEANDRHTKLLEKMERVKNSPVFMVTSTSAHGQGSNVTMRVENMSENMAVKITASNFMIVDEDGKTIWHVDSEMSREYFTGKSKWVIEWQNPPIQNNKCRLMFDIKYLEKFGVEHTCKVVGSFGERIDVPAFKIEELNN